jgi:hypothetical protein
MSDSQIISPDEAQNRTAARSTSVTPLRLCKSDSRELDTDSSSIAVYPTQIGKTIEDYANDSRKICERNPTWRSVTNGILYGPDFPKMTGSSFKMLAIILSRVTFHDKKTARKYGRIKNDEVKLTNNFLQERGISPSSRKRSIKELEALGYIKRLPCKSIFEATKVKVLKWT